METWVAYDFASGPTAFRGLCSHHFVVHGADFLELEIFSGPWCALDPQHCEHRDLVNVGEKHLKNPLLHHRHHHHHPYLHGIFMK